MWRGWFVGGRSVWPPVFPTSHLEAALDLMVCLRVSPHVWVAEWSGVFGCLLGGMTVLECIR